MVEGTPVSDPQRTFREFEREFGDCAADLRYWNVGIGMISAVSKRKLRAAEKTPRQLGEKFHIIGEVVKSDSKQVQYAG